MEYTLTLDKQEVIDLLELIAEEIEESFGEEFEAYRARLQAVYDRLLKEVEKR